MAMVIETKQYTQEIIVSERNIQKVFAAQKNDIFCPIAYNLSCRGGEADILAMRTSGYAEEFEVKISRSDLLADKKKGWKHDHYNKLFTKWTFEKCDHSPTRFVPNRFSYLVHESVGLPPKSIPEYAGYYIVKDDGHIKTERHPKIIHKEKCSDWYAKIATSLSWRLMNHHGMKEVEFRNHAEGTFEPVGESK